jgi:hypothetical protein
LLDFTDQVLAAVVVEEIHLALAAMVVMAASLLVVAVAAVMELRVEGLGEMVLLEWQ